jgi:hypothetical protein
MLDDITTQRNRQIEMQTDTILHRRVVFRADFLESAEQINLLAGLTLFEQARALLHCSRLDSKVSR